jgi:hypothetical protein
LVPTARRVYQLKTTDTLLEDDPETILEDGWWKTPG